ncbi:hypothetical protein AB0M44_01045 [Streptosporangium subroseum]|uniref:hypothetical protein n=1 Tax=Streptosporangium subroseum TaxID=106412 RepID=UPI003428FEC3
MLETRLTTRGVHSRFEHDGSSLAEVTLYGEFAKVLADDGFPLWRVDTGEVSPQVTATAIADRIRRLSSRG